MEESGWTTGSLRRRNTTGAFFPRTARPQGATLASTATLSFHDTWRPRANPWVIAITVTLATFMEALDTSIANVAMGHIGGSLSASRDEATWVLTSYLVANAVVLPISGWIANRIGRKRFYMTCVLLFTMASLLCGIAPSLGVLVFCRVLQGAAGGGLQPSEQSILADTFPPEKRSMAFAVYGMAVVLAPVLGPTVGGWIVDNYSWRWIFFINIPVGILSLYLTNRVVEDPPYLEKIRKRRESIDYWGLGLLVLAIGALQILLDKGQEDDWFSSRFIIVCAVIAAVGIAIFIVRQLSVEHPILDLRLFAQRNVGTTMFVMFMVGVSLYSSTVLIPQFLQEIMGYSAEQAGMAVSSGGIALMFLFPVAGALAPKFDPRWLVAMGFTITTFGLYRMTGMDLTAVDGLQGTTVLRVIAETGLDMSRWPAEKHFASWLTLCPGVNKTGGRSESKNGRTRRSSNRAAAVLRVAAATLLRAECALGAFARRLRARLGAPKAITATARKLAIIIDNMLNHGKPYVDQGVEYYEHQYRATMVKNLRRRAAQLGFELLEAPTGPSPA